MPPKRKAAAKATEVLVENGAEKLEPPKAKRGKAAKPVVEEVDPVEEPKKSGRTTRANSAQPKKDAKEKEVVEEEGKKEKATKSKAKEAKETKKVTTKGKKEAADTEKASTTKSKGDSKAAKAKTTKKKNDEIEKSSTEKTATQEEPITEDKTLDPPKAKKARKEKAEKSDTAKTESLQNKTETDYTKIDFTCSKENTVGKLPNFKISCWNVDGIRAWLKKNGHEYIKMESPDILCLQETKCSNDKIPDELNKYLDYKTYWCSSAKEGYAGVALFTKEEPITIEYGISNEEFDEEGRCITAEYEKFYVVNVYVPNAGRKLVTLDKRLEWNTIFKDYVAKLDTLKPVIVCGDMNVAHNEIDLTNPKTNKRNAGFTQEERDGMTEFLGDEYVDTYRQLYPEKEKAYTFWSYMMKARSKNIGWRLDYFIVSKRLMDNVCDNVIRSEVYGSDHCPITLYLNM